MKKDRLFKDYRHKIGQFTFDQAVAEVFTDMLNRSIPGYQSILSMIGMLAERFAQEDANYYDLGSSLGAVTLALAKNLPVKKARLIAVDKSPAMVSKSYATLSQLPYPVQLRLESIQETPIEKAAIVVLNYTLQFIAPEDRQAMINKIYQGLNPGGILILSEKIHFPHPAQDELMTELYYDFKRAQGYSELEISQKRDALENVLITDSLETHQQRLKQAGFRTFDPWFQAFNFISLVAVK